VVEAVVGHTGNPSQHTVDDGPIRAAEAIDLAHARVVRPPARLVIRGLAEGRQRTPQLGRIGKQQDPAGVEQDRLDRAVAQSHGQNLVADVGGVAAATKVVGCPPAVPPERAPTGGYEARRRSGASSR
jgi:hypothetical protein